MTVVVPFHGTADEARDAAARLADLRLGPRDRVLLVDNTPGGTAVSSGSVEVVRSPVDSSAYAARNVGMTKPE